MLQCKQTNSLGFTDELTSNQVTSITFSSDGRSLGVADGSKILVFVVPSFEQAVVLRGHTATVYEVDFGDSGNGSDLVLASASGDQTARVWTVEKVVVQNEMGS